MFDIGWIATAALMTATVVTTAEAQPGQSADWSGASIGHWYWYNSARGAHFYLDLDSISGPETDRQVRVAFHIDPPVAKAAWRTIIFSFDCHERNYRTLKFISYPGGGAAMPSVPTADQFRPSPVTDFSVQGDVMAAACHDELDGMVEVGRPLDDAARLAHLLAPLVNNDRLHAGALAAAPAENVRAMPDEALARWVKPGRVAQVRALLEP